MEIKSITSREYILKLVLVGDGGVGKTSIRRRYMGQGFTKSHLMTLGADFAEKKILLEVKGKKVHIKLQIWDIAGQDSFHKIRLRFLSNTSAIILVFDITNFESFQSTPNWLKEVWNANNSRNMPILVVGNKIDLDNDRKVSQSQLDQFIGNLKTKMKNKIFIEKIETCALTGENIEKGFNTIAKAFYYSKINEK